MANWNFNLNKSQHIGEDLPEPIGFSKNFASEVKIILSLLCFKYNTKVIESEKKQSNLKELLEKV